jgi:hypothetical protein
MRRIRLNLFFDRTEFSSGEPLRDLDDESGTDVSQTLGAVLRRLIYR